MAKKVFKQKHKITAGQFGTVLEDINDKFDFLVESHSALDAKIDKNHGEFKEFRKEVNFKFDLISKRFDGVDKNFKVVFEYLSKIDDEVQSIKLELKEIKLELNKKADLNRLEILEKRVKELEKSNMEMRTMIMQKAS